jgi:TonB family protein
MPGARRLFGEDTLKWVGLSLLYYLCATACRQTRPAICPKHIETPEYPLLARQTRQMGEVTLSVTIDAEGKVQHVVVMPVKPNQRAYQLLQDSAIENVQHWTFVKPPTAPYTEVIVYDYEDDPSLPPSGGAKRTPVITKVLFDLPDHVRILTNVPIIDANKSKIQP